MYVLIYFFYYQIAGACVDSKEPVLRTGSGGCTDNAAPQTHWRAVNAISCEAAAVCANRTQVDQAA